MNTIIEKLSRIEEEANKVLSEEAAKKQELTREYEERAARFDEELAAETKQKIDSLRDSMEKEMKKRLDSQEQDALASIDRLEHHYEAHHEEYVNQLFQSMTEV